MKGTILDFIDLSSVVLVINVLDLRTPDLVKDHSLEDQLNLKLIKMKTGSVRPG